MGYIFGKYTLENEIKKYLIKDEEYLDGIEIINYFEEYYIIGFLSILITIFLSIKLSLLFLLLIFPIFYVIYLSTELELIYLTSERIVIEKRTIVEKVLRTSNIQSIAIDQIAIVAYSRPPFQMPSLISGTLLIIFSIFRLLNIFTILSSIHWLIALIVFPIGIYMFYFGLRLNKRSIELSVIGVPKPIGIGRKKGAALSFLDALQMIVFERVHHSFHDDAASVNTMLHEFPLEFSGRAKELIENIKKPLQKKILQLLDTQKLPKTEIIKLCPNYSPQEVSEALRQLRQMRYIYYQRSSNCWCINRDTLIEELLKNKV